MATIKHRGTGKDGKDTWLIRVFVDGKQVCKTVHGTQKQAERLAMEMEIRRDQGDPIALSKQSVAEYMEEWLETYQKPAVSVITFAENGRMVKQHVIPAIGAKRLAALNTMECQRLINSIAAKGHKRTSVMVFNLMRKAFRQAKRLQLIAKSPMEDVIKTKDHAAERPFLSTNQTQQLLVTAKSSRFYSLIAFLLLTGVRPEEAVGLQWDSIDFQAKTVQIKQALKRQPGGGWQLDELKTLKSRRQLDIGNLLVSILTDHRRDQAEHRLIFGAKWHQHNFVFTGETGEPSDLSKVRKHFKKALEQAQLPQVRLYDLRHSHGSILLEQGVHIKTISDRLGHANATMTINRYLHVHPSVSRQAVDALDAALIQPDDGTDKQAQ